MSQAQFRQLSRVRDGLLRLHKSLLDAQRAEYERAHGPVASAGQFLQLVIAHPDFDWLHRFSELVVQIDEATDGDEPLTPPVAESLLDQTRRLISDEDDARYRALVERDETSASLLGELITALGAE